MKMKALSLFSGIGGFDLAAKRVGIRTRWHSEIDRNAQSVFARHFPESQAIGDVAAVHPDHAIRPDVLFAGWPCQDLSVAGRRAGLDGSRSGLFTHVERLIRELAPRWVCLENVPGLLSSCEGRDMARVVTDLSELGYGVAWRVLDAQWFGVPQRRRRVFFVGCLNDLRSVAEVLLEPDRLPWDSSPRRKEKANVTGNVTASYGGSGVRPEDADNLVTGTIGRRYGQSLACDDAEAYIPFSRHSITSPVNGSNPKAGDPSPTLSVEAPLVAHAVNGKGSRFGSGRGVPVAEMQTGVRRLMPVECERLQGFPDGWTERGADGKALSDSARYSLIGNAVCVPVAEWILRRLVNVDSK